MLYYLYKKLFAKNPKIIKDPILNELREDLQAEKNYLFHIHSCLTYLITYYNTGSYGITFRALYRDFYFKEFLNNEWGTNIISNDTKAILNSFHEKWYEYVQNKSYGDDFWVFYDPEYQKLIQTNIITSLEAIELDLRVKGVFEEMKIEGYKTNYDPNSRPSDEEILWKIETLYSLLYKDRGIKKPFMGKELD